MLSIVSDPLKLFAEWFEQALEGGLVEPSAMTLATVSPAGRPSARMVLLKHVDEDGFVFCTSYSSRKGEELAHTPWGALVMWWDRLHRQVRVEGPVERVSAEESDRYFANRPRGSQLGASASPQSAVIDSRAVLEDRVRELESAYRGREIPRPQGWGGYRVRVDSIEFWEGREDRLHDRLRFRRQGPHSWIAERLGP